MKLFEDASSVSTSIDYKEVNLLVANVVPDINKCGVSKTIMKLIGLEQNCTLV